MNCLPPPDATPEQRKAAVDLFYEQEHYNAAKRLCFTCPAQATCLRDGLNEPSGVWGGLAEGERKMLRALLRREGLKL